MKPQTKLWIGVALGFGLLAAAWTAMFMAASRANVQSIPLSNLSNTNVRNTNIVSSGDATSEQRKDAEPNVRIANIGVSVDGKSGEGR